MSRARVEISFTMRSRAERLREMLDHLGLTQVACAKALGYSSQYVSQLMRCREKITPKFAEKLSAVVGVSARWLLNGQGKPFTMRVARRPPGGEWYVYRLETDDLDLLRRIEQVAEREPPAVPELNVTIVAAERDVELIVADADYYVGVPCVCTLEDVACRPLRTSQIESYVLLRREIARDPRSMVCVEMPDRSMQPTIPKGAFMAIDLARSGLKECDGGVVCARQPSGEVLIARLVLISEIGAEGKRDSYAVLIPENPPESAEHILVDLKENASPVLGQVVWAARDLRVKKGSGA